MAHLVLILIEFRSFFLLFANFLKFFRFRSESCTETTATISDLFAHIIHFHIVASLWWLLL